MFELLNPNFQKNKIDFALIGALALYFSGVTMDTVDIDFVVLLSQSKQLDIEDLIRKNKTTLNFGFAREYFKLFNREKELDELLGRLG